MFNQNGFAWSLEFEKMAQIATIIAPDLGDTLYNNFVDISQDGKVAAFVQIRPSSIYGDIKFIKFWDIAKNKILHSIPIENNIRRFHHGKFNPDGTIFADFLDERVIRLWSVQTGQIIIDISLPEPYYVKSTGFSGVFAFSHDSRLLAFNRGTDKRCNTLVLFDLRNGQELCRFCGM
jgi:WD40 repeat protein